ncbi:zinc transporter ZIP5 [Chanos chanos]|uniref:Zinc transporter ZIP5 n=1 Tax=Chanos chanos TaxID=29144 RepID=A0A6J2V3C9_CHACN|nr:zinc transporter ZIP5 [Chanos chanos]XP_030625736.1 zinc transporter ZIP5 [Chanos chanos]XP_030625737.1 zinc transporter ZIP5 [Chanos chanos]
MQLNPVISICLSLLVIPVDSLYDIKSSTSPAYGTVSSSLEEDPALREHLKEAFEEQGYYLQRLFLQYGDNGTLTYEGLQKLLGSLGLGEVSVLEIGHDGTSSHPHTHLHLDEPRTPHSRAQGPSPTTHTHRNPDPKTAGSNGFGSKINDPVRTSHPGVLPLGHWRGSFEELSLLTNHATKKHLHGNCLNVTQLLCNFGLEKASHITPAQFTFLCPALLYQIDSGVCLRHSEGNRGETSSGVGFLKALGWSSLALTIISLPSLVALGLARLLPPARLHVFLCPMAALAVGTLCGDALLHLLPHARFGPHSESSDPVKKGLTVLGGLYLLFVIESLLGLLHHYKKSKKRGQCPESVREIDPLEGFLHPEQTESVESRHGHSHSSPDSGPAHTGTMAWMVAMGDGIHNLTDGLAIGVAFSQSLTVGLSTTIAVFCHELPHELGDMAILLAAGWPMCKLAVFSAISALLGFVGLLAGIVLGHQWIQLSPWLLTVTAGVFLYVALADMMPEMLHGRPKSASPLLRFLLQNLGLLTGVGIMLCIALFEDHISINLGDG